MKLDAELEANGLNSKARAKIFNRIWHPYLPRKVSAMQWLILTEGLPVGAWRERIGLPNKCQLCPIPTKETLQHAFQECPEIARIWELYRSLRRVANIPPYFTTWHEISRGLMRDIPGPQVEEELRWDTAAAFSVNAETPWDLLRAQLLWSVWRQRVEFAFREEHFHLGVVLWHAWRNTIYSAMEAYKELFRHARNEEKRQEMIHCFQEVWTAGNIFGRIHNGDIRWHLTPPKEFLPEDLGAWTAAPICIHRLSPSPDVEAEFVARPDFGQLVDEFVQAAANRPPAHPIPTTGDASPHRANQPVEDSAASQGRSSDPTSMQDSPIASPIYTPQSAPTDRDERSPSDKENLLLALLTEGRVTPQVFEDISNSPSVRASQRASTSRPLHVGTGKENSQGNRKRKRLNASSQPENRTPGRTLSPNT